MGKYLDALNNLSVSEFNATYDLKNDTITEMIKVTREETNNNFGVVLLSFLWVVLYVHIAKIENNFNVSYIQAFISVNIIVFNFALMFLYLGIMGETQTFIWVVLAIFLTQVWGIIRSSA